MSPQFPAYRASRKPELLAALLRMAITGGATRTYVARTVPPPRAAD